MFKNLPFPEPIRSGLSLVWMRTTDPNQPLISKWVMRALAPRPEMLCPEDESSDADSAAAQAELPRRKIAS